MKSSKYYHFLESDTLECCLNAYISRAIYMIVYQIQLFACSAVTILQKFVAWNLKVGEILSFHYCHSILLDFPFVLSSWIRWQIFLLIQLSSILFLYNTSLVWMKQHNETTLCPLRVIVLCYKISLPEEMPTGNLQFNFAVPVKLTKYFAVHKNFIFIFGIIFHVWKAEWFE